MLYATWSRGFKPGGFQALASTASAAGPYGDETMGRHGTGHQELFFGSTARVSVPIYFTKTSRDLQRAVVFLQKRNQQQPDA